MLIDVRSQSFSNALTEEEQAAIDEAVQAGKVRKVPRGVSGLPESKWFQTGPDSGRLRTVDKAGKPVTSGWKSQKGRKVGRRKSPEPSPHILVRRDRVKELHASGMKDGEIAKLCGVTASIICSDRFALGLPSNHERIPRSERLKQIQRHHKAGMTTREAAAAMGLSLCHVRKLATELGLKMARPCGRAGK